MAAARIVVVQKGMGEGQFRAFGDCAEPDLDARYAGVFLAADLLLFYVFWEAMLVPMYFLIGTWGYDRRIYAALKFFIYTAAGSALLLLGILSLAVLQAKAPGAHLTFDLRTLMAWKGLNPDTARDDLAA